jgi:hypothetical protein
LRIAEWKKANLKIRRWSEGETLGNGDTEIGRQINEERRTAKDFKLGRLH